MQEPPRVAIIHDHLVNLGGAECVLRDLVALFQEAPVYTFTYDPLALASIFQDRVPKIIASSYQRWSTARRWPRWFLPTIPSAFESFDLKKFDLILSSTSGLAKGVVTHPGQKHVSYCHTPTRYLWSDAASYLEEIPLPRALRGILPLYLSSLRVWDYTAAQRVDHFIANSEFVAQRIHRYYGRSASVCYPAIDVNKFTPATRTTRGDYFLLISRLRPYKRVDLVVDAFNHTGIPLVVIGVGSEGKRLARHARSNISFRGFVTDRARNDLLRNCRALIHPQEEDFGLTVIEAHATGRPVVAYRAGGARETIIENVNGVFFDEQSWESLADTIVRFEDEQFDPARIRESAQRFDKVVFRKRLIELLESFGVTGLLVNPATTTEILPSVHEKLRSIPVTR